jgi:hypothetical protein
MMGVASNAVFMRVCRVSCHVVCSKPRVIFNKLKRQLVPPISAIKNGDASRDERLAETVAGACVIATLLPDGDDANDPGVNEDGNGNEVTVAAISLQYLNSQHANKRIRWF